jgi:hypothetical protein
MDQLHQIDFIESDPAAAAKHSSAGVERPAWLDVLQRSPLSVVSLHPFHDSNLCLAVDGTVVFVLELERVWGVRHFASTTGVLTRPGLFLQRCGPQGSAPRLLPLARPAFPLDRSPSGSFPLWPATPFPWAVRAGATHIAATDCAMRCGIRAGFRGAVPGPIRTGRCAARGALAAAPSRHCVLSVYPSSSHFAWPWDAGGRLRSKSCSGPSGGDRSTCSCKSRCGRGTAREPRRAAVGSGDRGRPW